MRSTFTPLFSSLSLFFLPEVVRVRTNREIAGTNGLLPCDFPFSSSLCAAKRPKDGLLTYLHGLLFFLFFPRDLSACFFPPADEAYDDGIKGTLPMPPFFSLFEGDDNPLSFSPPYSELE